MEFVLLATPSHRLGHIVVTDDFRLSRTVNAMCLQKAYLCLSLLPQIVGIV